METLSLEMKKTVDQEDTEVFKRFLKARMFRQLRIKVAQQILVKDLHSRIKQRQSTFNKQVTFLTLKRHLIINI